MLNSKFWKKYFKVYDILNIVIPYNKLLNDVVEKLDVEEGDCILDAGAGTGNLTLKLKARGAHVFSLDNVREAQDIHRSKDKESKIIEHDISKNLPFKEEYFNKICSNNVIYTIPEKDRKNVFDEFYRVLKPGGVIVISNINKNFKPLKIYLDHLKKEYKNSGLFFLLFRIIKLFIPTIKMFYYNNKIKKENSGGSYSFLNFDEQIKLLKNSNFKKISSGDYSYAGQAVINKAVK